MSIWEITSEQWPDVFNDLTPSEVLVEYDFPLTFTCSDKRGNLMLAHLLACDSNICRFVASPTDNDVINDLKRGSVSIRQALDQPIVWIVDLSLNGEIQNCWGMSLADVPGEVLPNFDVLLYPELEPLIRTYSTGELIRPGHIPADALRAAFDSVQTAIRKLTNFATQRSGGGRPAEEYRQLYQLEVQGLAFNSISIDFKRKSLDEGLIGNDVQRDVCSRVENLFVQGLRWMQTGEFEEGASASEKEAMLNAMIELSPSVGSAISKVEISGKMTRGTQDKVHLTQMNRKLASEARNALRKDRPQPAFVSSAGRVREADKDRRSFDLRERPDNQEDLKFVFDEDDADSVLDAFDGDYFVYVIGRPTSGNALKLLEIIDINELQDDVLDEGASG